MRSAWVLLCLAASAAAQDLPDTLTVPLRAADIAPLLSREEGGAALAGAWWELKALRSLLGPQAAGATALAHARGPGAASPEYAFFAVDLGAAYRDRLADVKRSFVLLHFGKQAALAAFDLVTCSAPSTGQRWIFDSSGVVHPWKVEVKSVLPAAGDAGKPAAERLFLNVVQFFEQGGAPLQIGEVDSIDLAGVRLAGRVVLFHRENTTANSALSFSVRGEGTLKYLVTGLAPGYWQIWRDGWLDDPQALVRPREGALYFEGPAGDYFLRRL